MNKTHDILEGNSKLILKELGIENLSPEEEKVVVEEIMDHFYKVIIETTLLNLNEQQINELKKALEENNFEKKIVEITAGVPGLEEKIEKAVEDEFNLLKEAYKAAS